MRFSKIKIAGILVLVFFFYSLTAADQLCEMAFSSCPEDFNGDTIFVPPQVVALSSSIFACDPTEVIEGIIDSGGPPSIMFVIDHSYSMMGLGNTHPGNDTYGARFNVTRDLIDTIYRLHPDAQVGLVVFREVLYFDHRNNNFFETLDGQGDQSFLPLLQLNKTISGSTTGLQALRSTLKTDTIIDTNRYVNSNKPFAVECVDLVYKPKFSTVGNTNINNAFAAALQGMKKSIYPSNRRFIIFLSDGEPFPVTPTASMSLDSIYKQHGGKEPFYFQNAINTPTTFTVYLHNTDITAPQSLQKMTANIRTNNYSTSNTASEIWTLKTTYESLMELFMKKIILPFMTLTTGTATSMTVNSIVSTDFGNDGFIFRDRFPLSADPAKFDIRINYHLVNQRTLAARDTIVRSTLYVERKEGALVPSGIVTNCWNRGDLSLYYNGQPVTFVNETMDRLQIRFNSGSIEHQYVIVNVTNYAGQTRDSEMFTLEKGSSYWDKTFLRQIEVPQKNNGSLQHQMVDSIILVYRNPLLPLDTLRIAVPFSISKNIVLTEASYNDRNADGFIDSIFIGTNNTLSNGDLEELKNLITLPAYRNFTVDSLKAVSGGLIYYVQEKAVEPRTYTTNSDIISVNGKVLDGGGLVISSTISVQDNVAPVIVSAQLVTSNGQYDSLVVTFSEPVKTISSLRPFSFKKPGGGEYEVFVNSNGVLNGAVFSVRVEKVQADFSISVNDSVWINTIASICDTRNNIQNNPVNRRVQISVKQVPYTIVTNAVNNPLSFGVKIPQPVQDAYNQAGLGHKLDNSSGGMTIIVEPQLPLRSHIILSGKASIYDVVKNTVIKDQPLVYDKGKQKLYFFWNGQNSKGRKVATGTYMAVIEVHDNQDFKDTRTIRIGVKR